MSHDQPARLACRAPRALRLPCLHQPTPARPALDRTTPMTRRPTTAALTYRPDRLDAETLPTVLLDGVPHVPVTAVVAWLDRHADRWDAYALEVDRTPEHPDPAEEDTRTATIVGAYAIADELTHRATDLTRLHAAANLDEETPHLTGTPKAVEGCRAVLLALVAGLLAWLILAGWFLR